MYTWVVLSFCGQKTAFYTFKHIHTAMRPWHSFAIEMVELVSKAAERAPDLRAVIQCFFII